MGLNPLPKREKVAAVIIAAVIILLGYAVFAIDYLHGRAAVQLLQDLAQLPPGTPLEAFEKRFGKPLHHLTSAESPISQRQVLPTDHHRASQQQR